MTDINSELTKKMNYLNNTLKQLRQFKISRLSLIDPNSGQGKVLTILKKDNSIPQNELVEKLDMKRQSASELIRKLEHKGLLSREKSAEDKRIFIVSLTEKGEEFAGRLGINEEDYMNALSDDDKQNLSRILDTLIRETDSQYEIAKDNFGVNLFGPKKQNKK
ncbi:MarR family winged helix-turn-helix transcriptional regulator [Lentilactobacillus kosonis]|uniref:Transcriptional regulator, MarR family n=1 Tax=Lentilactobacillus kosonis TaxID=2810561 RepID=A0A401FI48_9LACO|nr:MarR family transcriptional regulator [Lentilactobacillus kosonis]GAY71931.1 transcriptional regulator, MarR family [Lentilactobacillus kosonis]